MGRTGPAGNSHPSLRSSVPVLVATLIPLGGPGMPDSHFVNGSPQELFYFGIQPRDPSVQPCKLSSAPADSSLIARRG